MNFLKATISILATTLIFSCTKVNTDQVNTQLNNTDPVSGKSASIAASIFEDFENGTKTAYAAADVTLGTGVWNINDGLIGNSTSDRKNGTKSARVRNSGKLTMKFDNTSGASTVTVMHALYGTDASSTWQLWYSTNAGTSYTQTGATITTSSTILTSANFTVNIAGNIRFEIRKTDGSTNRINFDDFSISPYSVVSSPVLSSISPNTANAGAATFIISTTGSNFTNASTIDWNGTALTTTYISATSLTASVPAANISTAGTNNITVTTSGAGSSAALPFTVNAVVLNPTLTAVSPNTVTAGNTSFTLTASGTNFSNNSTVNWNGSPLTTTFVNATSLTASVPAANVALAGTASITVATPGATTSTAIIFTITNPTTTTKRFLFDATKAETAGNADWSIDEDNGSPKKVPTPAQSNISSSTSESYWTGALSSWGIALVKSGNFVETLPSSGSITYGNSANLQDLSNYDVFVVDEPNTRFTASEKLAILNFVKNGGGLFMISDHTISDRNNDGWDSPAIWNDLMTNNTQQNNPFGFSIDLTNISQVSTNVLTNNSSNPILHGIKGNVTKLEFNNGATLTLQPAVNSNVQGLIWQNTYAQNSTHVMAASSTYGTGRVFVVTDSSPMDDGTGVSGNSLYVSWPLYSHTQLFMNASLWLAKIQ